MIPPRQPPAFESARFGAPLPQGALRRMLAPSADWCLDPDRGVIERASPEIERLCLAALARDPSINPNATLGRGSRRVGLLCCAAAMGATELCEALIRRGAALDTTASFGPGSRERLSALGAACLAGFDDTGAALSRLGADPMAPLSVGAATMHPAWLAIFKGLPKTLSASIPRINFDTTIRTSGLSIACASSRPRQWGLMLYAAIHSPAMFTLLMSHGVPPPQNMGGELREMGYPQETIDWALGTFAGGEKSVLDSAAPPSPRAQKSGARL